MSDSVLAERRTYELTSWRIRGPVGEIPILLFHRLDFVGPKSAIIYYHGVTQSKESYVDTHPTARRLADEGFLVALPDAPGHGQRPGGSDLVARLRDSLPREFSADIEQAGLEAESILDWLTTRPSINRERVGIAGVSMGGYTAAVVAARVKARIRAAVCVAGCADLAYCMATTDSIAPGKWGPPDRSIDEPTRERIARIDPMNYPDRYAPLPLLLVHGGADTWNPPVTSERFAELLRPYYAANPGALRLAIVPGAPHWPPNPVIIQETVDWLVQHVAAAISPSTPG